MWKILAAFAVFAAAVLFVIARAGGSVDMGGEQHGAEVAHPPAAAAASGVAQHK